MKLVKLADLLDVMESGGRPRGGASSDTGEIPSLGAENIDNRGDLRFDSVKRVRVEFFSNLKSGRIATGDILVVKDGATTGRVALVTREFPYAKAAINEHLFRLAVKKSIVDPHYLYEFLASSEGKRQILLDFRGATVGGIGRSFIERIVVPLPSLEKQKKAARVLRIARNLCDAGRNALSRSQDLANSIFLTMFGDPGPNPRGWTRISVADLKLKISDGNYAEKYPTVADFVDDGVPFIRASNIVNLSIDSTDLRYITTAKHEELRKGHLLSGDVLVTTRGDIGKVAVVPADFAGANLNAQLVLLRPFGRQLGSEFLGYLLNTDSMRQRLRSLQTGVALKQLPVGALRRVLLPVPPFELQEKFGTAVRAINTQQAFYSKLCLSGATLLESLRYRSFCLVEGSANSTHGAGAAGVGNVAI